MVYIVESKFDWCQTDASMNAPHVVVNSLAFRECLETFPTNMCLTTSACHVVTPFCSLNWNFTSRTVLDVMFLHPFPEAVVTTVRVRAYETVVSFNVAAWAYAKEAGGALEDSPPGSGAVDLGAVGGRTIMKLVGPGLDIRGECGVYDGVKFMHRKDFLCDAQWNVLCTFGVVSETGKREILVVDRGHEII